MATVKTEALALIQAMPDDITWEEIHYRVYMWAKVQQGLADIEAGRGIPHDQVMREMDEWLASSGHPEPATTSGES